MLPLRSPAVVSHTSLLSDLGECSIMVVVKESGTWRRYPASERVVSRAVHQIEVEPAVIVVQQSHPGTIGLDDVPLLESRAPIR
ncbi:MAG TPA: hypothetical protein VHZ09_03480 [Acidobacteriaceae bacterium]|nr:hypothetical protein [Acidobacteriaceae bacterium]